jgi:acyl-CoA thioesterase
MAAERPDGRTYRARAWWGGTLLAESTAAIRSDPPEQAPVLWFPTADIRFDALTDEDRWADDKSSLWSVDDPEGRDVLRVHGEGAEGAWPAGFACFDPDRVRIEIVDGRPDDDQRDVTTKSFPNWGDAAHLVEMLDVQPDGDHRYVSVVRPDWRRPVVEGSQMLAQSIVAAGRQAPGRRPVSASMVFARAADARTPIVFELSQITAGRTFSTYTTLAQQGGRVCGVGTVLLDSTAPDVIRHAVAPPDVPGPYDCAPFDMSVTGRDLRIVDDAYTGDPDAPVGPPVLDAWVRFRDLPDEPLLHAALLTQFTGHLSIAAALRPHAGVGQDQAHRTLSTAPNAITIAVHRDVRADQWMLYHHESTFAGDGMTHADCRVHDEDGDLLASFTVEAMVRAFGDPTAPVDDRTAL